MRAPSPRLALLLAVLLALAGLVLFDDGEQAAPHGIVEAAAAGRRASDDGPRLSPILALKPRTEPSTPPAPTFFGQHDWTPPLPPPPPAPPPPPPQAPALPFSYLGKQLVDGEWTVFLAHKDRTYTVRTGDTIEAAYRVDRIAPPTLTLSYLALRQQQTLVIGTAE